MVTATPAKYPVRYRYLHPKQAAFVHSPAKRKIARCGRRGGKTVGVAQLCVDAFLHGHRVLYGVPTANQLDTFWFEVKRALEVPLARGVFRKNESEHFIEVAGTQNRIRAKTAWNADSLRGDYADMLILDEWQLMDEDAWERVGQPMLLDNDGTAVFIYTPPSLASRSVSKARDPRHAAKMFKMAQDDPSGEWEAFAWASHDNPFISPIALDRVARSMTRLAYAQEILALDATEAPGALWRQAEIDEHRVTGHPELRRIVVAIDPAVTSSEQSDETGILVGGRHEKEGYVLEDGSGRYSPRGWAVHAIDLFDKWKADRIIGETNNGGDMIEETLRAIRPNIPFKKVTASRGKDARAEPVAALYEKGMVHHVGQFPLLEEQLCTWERLSTHRSPDRLDALVWAMTELMVGAVPTTVRGERQDSPWRDR
jgi:phage terminase large subunit-like protein